MANGGSKGHGPKTETKTQTQTKPGGDKKKSGKEK